MAKAVPARENQIVSLESSLNVLGQKINACKATRTGTIVFRASGSGGSCYGLDTSMGQTKVIRFTETMMEKPPLIEFIGDAAILQAVIDNEKKAFRTFLGGGIRVRGDLRYLSELALALGYIDKPL